MGNNQSQQPMTPVEVVRRPPRRPGAPPTARPVSELGPRGPSYKDPGNRVLPAQLPLMKLRPVSQELSKYHPEFESMFHYEDDDDDFVKDGNIDDIEAQENKKNLQDENEAPNSQTVIGSPPRPPPPIQNGHVPGLTAVPVNVTKAPVTNGSVPSEKTNGQAKPVSSSVQDSKPVYRPGHRRQMSATNNLTKQEHTIFEEPEESIDDRKKIDDLNRSYPGVSLPVKNNFDLDYAYQLTYVQLAEHRRQKTLGELEKRTGKKLSDLSADLSENAEKPASFSRDVLARASSRSTASTDSGPSRRKKKAPPPPSQAPPHPPGGSASAPVTPRYSLDNEPPADYDLPESPPRSNSVEEATVSPRGKVPPAVPPPPVVPAPPPPPAPPAPPAPTYTQKPAIREKLMNSGTPQIILKRTPSVKSATTTPETPSGQVPWLLEIKNLSEAREMRRQMSLEATETPAPPEPDPATDSKVDETDKEEPVTKKSEPNLVFQSSTETFMPATLKEPSASSPPDEPEEEPSKLQRQNSLKAPPKPSSPKLMRHHSSTVYDRQSTGAMQRQTSTPEGKAADPVRRLSSLLQHDIKVTAQAKCLKLVKQTTNVPPKPKDPHQVFREQLAKAASAREQRAKLEGTIDEKLAKEKTDSSNTSEAGNDSMQDPEVAEGTREYKRQTSTEDGSERKSSTSSSNPPEVKPKPRYHKNVSMNRHNNHPSYQRSNSRQMVHSSEDDDSVQHSPHSGHRSPSDDWIPGDDLDSDDNLSDREMMTARKGHSEGFKSTIIPNSVTDLKSKKKNKNKKIQQNVSTEPPEEPVKNKYGSIKRFKKSMHKGVRNAFGSLSKASGKILLRRQKAEDLETVDDAGRNWRFSSKGPSKRESSFQNGLPNDPAYKYCVPNGYADHQSESEEEADFEPQHRSRNSEFSDAVYNGVVHSEDESSPEEEVEKTPQRMKRAGVAYVGAKGQLVVLRDEDGVEIDEDGLPLTDSRTDFRAPKQAEKKKKFAYDATARRKEREEMEVKVSEGVRSKERQMDEERRKQLEMELEFHKIREAETRERLQRLEAAHLQAQFQQQQQQQQQQQHYSTMLTAPPLPPAGTFPPNYSNMPDLTASQQFSGLFNQAHLTNGLTPNFSLGFASQPGSVMGGSLPYDVNDYMRFLGLQNPPTSQVAYMLNSMTMTGPGLADTRKSTPLLYEMFNSDPMKAFPAQTVNYSMAGGAVQKQNYNLWASTPNLQAGDAGPITDRSLNEFASQLQYGANTTTTMSSEGKKGKDTKVRRNPIYNSDDSDEGMSPMRTVARAQVQDFRNSPVSHGKPVTRTASSQFMEKYRDSVQVRNKASDETQEVTYIADVLPADPGPATVTVNGVGAAPTAGQEVKVDMKVPASPAVATKHFGPSGHRTVVELNNASPSIHES